MSAEWPRKLKHLFTTCDHDRMILVQFLSHCIVVSLDKVFYDNYL